MSFPNHAYDFQENVYIAPLGKSGLVQGIRHKATAPHWFYQISTTGDRWWPEDELTYACPQCLSPVAPTDDPCPICGFPLDG